MKWLREHTKQIMVVVVLLAMFSFVGAEGLMMVLQPDQTKEVYMEVFGREVTRGELLEVQQDVDTLDTLGMQWRYDPEMRAIHLLMLSEEARRAGIQVADDEVEQRIEMMEASLNQQNRSLDDLRREFKISRPMIRRALGRMLLIDKNFSRLGDAAIPSEPQMRHYVRATQDKVQVKFAALDAEKFVDSAEVIGDEEAQAHFDQYKDRLASESENGMGYKYPQRVKVQYAVISLAALEPQMNVSDDEIREYWRAGKNRENYKKSIFVDDVPAGSPADTQPFEAKKVPEERIKEFSEAIPDVRRDLAKAKARKTGRQIADRLADELIKPWVRSGISEDAAFKKIPAGVDDPAYLERTANEMAAKFNVAIEYGETPLAAQQELAEHASLKGATTPGEKGMPLPLPELAFRVPGFYTPERGTDAGLYLQLFETPNPAFTVNKPGTWTFQNQQIVQIPGEVEKYVVFRVVETAESAVPASLAEVREKVDRDLRMLHAMNRMEQQVREIYAVARHLGLDKAVPLFTDLREKGMTATPTTAPPFARFALETDPEKRDELVEEGKLPLKVATVSTVGQSQAFIDACFEMTRPDWTNPAVGEVTSERLMNATTQPASQPEPKLQMVRAPELKKWFVVELISAMPVDSAQYESTKRDEALKALADQRRFAMFRAWFSPKRVEERCEHRPIAEREAADTAQGLTGAAS